MKLGLFLFLALYHQAVVSDTLCGVDKIKKMKKQTKNKQLLFLQFMTPTIQAKGH